MQISADGDHSKSIGDYSSRHIREIDYLRCFAILAVIYIHTAAATMRVEDVAGLFPVIYLSSLSQFAVPLFICISGFVLHLSYKPSGGAVSFYKRRYLRIIPPYLIFTGIYLIANIFKMRVISGTWNIPSVSEIACAYIFAESIPHMWFFLIIIELYLIYSIVSRMYTIISKKGLELLFLGTALLLQVSWNTFSINLVVTVNGIDQSLTNKIFLCMIFYFVLGMYLSRHYRYVRPILKKYWIYILTFPVFLLAIPGIIVPFQNMENCFSVMMGIGFCIAAIFLLFAISVQFSDNSICKKCILIGTYSFGIYLVHPLIQGLFGYVVYPMMGIDPGMLIYYLLVFITTTLLSILGVYLIQKLPYHQYIIG